MQKKSIVQKMKNMQLQKSVQKKLNAERVEKGAGAEDPVGEPHEEVDEEVESASGRLKHNG